MWNGKYFGKRLRGARRRSQLTQQALHEAANVSERTIRYLEQGKGTPSVGTVYKLAHALDVPLGYLLPDLPD